MAEKLPQLLADVRGEWRQQYAERFQDFPFAAFQVGKFVHTNHECADRCVVGHFFNILAHLFDGAVQDFQLFGVLTKRESFSTSYGR